MYTLGAKVEFVGCNDLTGYICEIREYEECRYIKIRWSNNAIIWYHDDDRNILLA